MLFQLIPNPTEHTLNDSFKLLMANDYEKWFIQFNINCKGKHVIHIFICNFKGNTNAKKESVKFVEIKISLSLPLHLSIYLSLYLISSSCQSCYKIILILNIYCHQIVLHITRLSEWKTKTKLAEKKLLRILLRTDWSSVHQSMCTDQSEIKSKRFFFKMRPSISNQAIDKSKKKKNKKQRWTN